MAVRCVQPTHSFIEFTIDEIEPSIPARFEQMVAYYPDRVALKTNRHELTYAALNEVANRIARTVLNACGEGQSPVALFFEQGPFAVASVLGVLKAGKFYVPLDPTHPPARTVTILQDAGAQLLLTDSKNVSTAYERVQGRLEIVNCEEIGPDIDGRNLGLSLSPDDLAWLIYTSGSTGQPKGVFQNHRNVLHFIRNYTNGVRLCSEDRLSLLRYVSFVGATRDIFAALLNGAALHPFDVRTEGAEPLAKWLIEEQITVCFFGSPLFRAFLDTLTGREEFPALRLIRLGSDAVRKQDVVRFQQYFSSRCILVNGLSSTETRTVCKFFIDNTTRISTSTVPVGYPVDGMEVRLLDDHGNDVEPGAVGEIVVRSRYLALGYWNRPDLTQAVFLDDPDGGDKRIYRTGDLGRMSSDGLLEHLGRKDFQVKIRGTRVEIPAIENALLEMDAIKDVVVVVREDHPGNQRLVAYVTPMFQWAPTVSAMQRTLSQTLPDYMIPSVFVMLETIPVSPNGKVDRRKLPKPESDRPTLDAPFVAARTPVERGLAAIWANVLGLDRVGVHDPFLELGGHSLLATQIISRVIEKYNVDISMRELMEAPTVVTMALVIVQQQTAIFGTEEAERLLAKLEGLPDG